MLLLSDKKLADKYKKDKSFYKYEMAMHLCREIAKAEGRMPAMDFLFDYKKIDKDWVLETFNDCIKAVEGTYK